MDSNRQFKLLKAMLSRVKTDDPYIKRLIERQAQDNRKEEPQEETAKDIIRRLKIQNKKLLEQLTILKEQARQNNADKNRVSAHLDKTMKWNNSLADALGSCPQCWGEDAGCKNCNGKGAAGWRPIHKRLFNIYVLPGLERLYGLIKE
jgi:hypothetical protein